MARKSIMDTRGGLISRGRCENPRCKLDLGNRLDPYCWTCATALTQRYEASRIERRAERAARHAPPPATTEQARTQLAEMLRQLGI